jgi:type VI secretion system protein ImpE
MNSRAFYDTGDLSQAIQAAIDDVKKAPTDESARGFLCELLCFAGEWEKADRQLETIGHQNAKSAVGVAMFRQLIRAAQARQQFYDAGRVPEFLVEPDDELRLRLQASIALREGKTADATTLLEQAESQRPAVSGECNGQAFEGFRDLDDLAAGYFEVLTSTGKYYWVPVHAVELMEFHAPVRPQDLLWRRVHMIVTGGPDGEVFLPTTYPGTSSLSDDQLRLGRATDWSGDDSSPIRGQGLRMFLAGENDLSILQLETVTFNQR